MRPLLLILALALTAWAGLPVQAARRVDRGLRTRVATDLPYANLFPNYATAAQLGVTSYPAYVRQFLETVRPKLFSFDHYALVGPGERPTYFENLEVIRREALRAQTPF